MKVFLLKNRFARRFEPAEIVVLAERQGLARKLAAKETGSGEWLDPAFVKVFEIKEGIALVKELS